MARETFIVVALVLLAAPIAGAADGSGGADENATWGLCQAQDANEQGNESSNGTVHDTAPFANVNESNCENASSPWAGTPGEDHVPDDPGDDNRNDSDDHPDEDDNPSDERP